MTGLKPLEALAACLGFRESETLSFLRGILLEAIRTQDREAELDILAMYRAGGAAAVEQQQEGDAYQKAQIGLIVAVASIWQEAGQHERYFAELDDAILYAWNAHLDDLVRALQAAQAAA